MCLRMESVFNLVEPLCPVFPQIHRLSVQQNTNTVAKTVLVCILYFYSNLSRPYWLGIGQQIQIIIETKIIYFKVKVSFLLSILIYLQEALIS